MLIGLRRSNKTAIRLTNIENNTIERVNSYEYGVYNHKSFAYIACF